MQAYETEGIPYIPHKLPTVYEHVFPGKKWDELKLFSPHSWLYYSDRLVNHKAFDYLYPPSIKRAIAVGAQFLQRVDFFPDKYIAWGELSVSNCSSLRPIPEVEGMLLPGERLGNVAIRNIPAPADRKEIFKILSPHRGEKFRLVNIQAIMRMRKIVVPYVGVFDQDSQPTALVYYSSGENGKMIIQSKGKMSPLRRILSMY